MASSWEIFICGIFATELLIKVSRELLENVAT
jgi:hypothetical protein